LDKGIPRRLVPIPERFFGRKNTREFLLVPTPMNTRVITNRSVALFSNLRGTEVYPLKEGNIKMAYI
jgi:hypothetical protein